MVLLIMLAGRLAERERDLTVRVGGEPSSLPPVPVEDEPTRVDLPLATVH